MASTKPSVEIKDLGIGKLKRELAKLRGQKITIGHQGRSGSATHPNAKGASVAEVAAFHEFGTPAITARPMIRTTFDRSKTEIDREVRRGISDLIDGRRKLETIQDELGSKMHARLRETIAASREWAEPLAQSTKDRKGHDQPLVDSKTLERKASWAVRDGDDIIRQGGDS